MTISQPHVGILVPSTTNLRDWDTFRETILYNVFFKTFLTTYDKEDYYYTIYLTIDDDDKVFSKEEEKEKIHRFIKIMRNVELKFVYTTGIQKGWVTHMWNRAFQQAYDDGCDYFFQCGDDIQFLNKGWVKESIKSLSKHNNIGLTGPIDSGRSQHIGCRPGESRFIQTQAFLARSHMEIFGFLFPPEIKNWFCDDWITKVYYNTGKFYIIDKYINNVGGTPRYNIVGSLQQNDPTKLLCDELINEHARKLSHFR